MTKKIQKEYLTTSGCCLCGGREKPKSDCDCLCHKKERRCICGRKEHPGWSEAK